MPEDGEQSDLLKRRIRVPLTSVRLMIALGISALVVVIVTVRLHRRRGRGRLLTTATGSIVVFALVLSGVAAGVNRHFQLYRTWAALAGTSSVDLVPAGSPRELARAISVNPTDVPLPAHGTLLNLTIPATTSHLDVADGFVYLPPQYRSEAFARKGFPVVEAFNGSPGQPGDWLNGVQAIPQLDAAITSHEMSPAIVVFPPTNLSVLRSLECTDTADGLLDETYLTTDVHAWVTSQLRTDGHRWTAMGYSTGGYCALDLAFRHPDLFARAISLDGYGVALSDRYARGLWRDAADRRAHSPNWWVQNHAPEKVDVYLSAGADDHEAAGDALAVWKALDVGGWRSPQNRLVVDRGGRHDFDGWKRAFIPSLRWALPGQELALVAAPPAVRELEVAQVARPACAKHRRHAGSAPIKAQPVPTGSARPAPCR